MSNQKFKDVVSKEDLEELISFRYSIKFNKVFEKCFEEKIPFEELLKTKDCVAVVEFNEDVHALCSFACNGNNTWEIHFSVIDFGDPSIKNRVYFSKTFEKVNNEDAFKKVLDEFNQTCEVVIRYLRKREGLDSLIELFRLSYFKSFDFDEYGDGMIRRKIKGEE